MLGEVICELLWILESYNKDERLAIPILSVRLEFEIKMLDCFIPISSIPTSAEQSVKPFYRAHLNRAKSTVHKRSIPTSTNELPKRAP